MKATGQWGALVPIDRAQIQIPIRRNFIPLVQNIANAIGVFPAGGVYTISLNVLPQVSDTKSSDYSMDHIVGRGSPIMQYSHTGSRVLGMKVTFLALLDTDYRTNLQHLRALQSAVYPSSSTQIPYVPPPICKIRIGNLLTTEDDGWLCVILKQYNTSYPIDVVWSDNDYIPSKLEVDLSWEVIYASSNLPGQSRIFRDVI